MTIRPSGDAWLRPAMDSSSAVLTTCYHIDPMYLTWIWTMYLTWIWTTSYVSHLCMEGTPEGGTRLFRVRGYLYLQRILRGILKTRTSVERRQRGSSLIILWLTRVSAPRFSNLSDSHQSSITFVRTIIVNWRFSEPINVGHVAEVYN